jgi:tetraacyldisaccharide 4'-kinase
MRLATPRWWYVRDGAPAPLTRALLRAPAWVWTWATRRRIAGARPFHPGVPVICVGNLTLGGSGKTPVVRAIVRRLAAAGRTPHVLMRGYGGRLKGPVRVDPAAHTAADVGDEAMLLARVAPTIVAHDRVAGANAVPADTTVIVMDDGLQNPSLAKTIAVAVIDGARGIGNGKVFPAGPLRAPIAAQLACCHALLVVGDAGVSAKRVVAAGRQSGLIVSTGRLMPDAAAVARLSGRDVLAFAGIGDPDKFYATLRAAGITVAEQRSFADHHVFTGAEAAELIAHADTRGLMLVTTEKDHSRMSGHAALAALAARSTTLPVALAIDDADWLGPLTVDVLHGRLLG